ncbi:NADPH-dependent FMN reductase [Nocardioides sp. PD653]|uniref:NADPH-dependent FMN reductase n=1 Tax=Nocardioides sp. PD653 TaxID=393303 RepID=UPI0009F06294|nr:NAD(P)H-dependent oxidoreductase [Nocardioides sp. PD653]GAW54774.1 putative hexachlorobenzene oxidative dehalogenase system reductase subunit [Nocardioides sp. PD653]
MNLVTVIGNPKPESRTRAAAEMLAHRLVAPAPGHTVTAVEVADLGAGLLGWGDPAVTEAKERVKAADLLIVASPTFKATYTGLLKLFLDQFSAGEIGGTTTIPLMLGAAPQHTLAAELTLKPVLVEIGCSCPTPALYLLDSAYDAEDALEGWLARARTTLPFLESTRS